MKKPKISRAAGLVALVILAGGALIGGAGVARYGSLDGLWRRASSELQQYLPHPDFVPTPSSQTAPVVHAPAPSLAVLLDQPVAQPDRTLPAPGGRLTGAGKVLPVAEKVAPSVTPQPTLRAVASPQATLPATTEGSLPASVRLQGLSHSWQTWNNCGPATLSMYMSYFGKRIGQDKIGAVLRPFRDDKNVNPWELADFAAGQGLIARAGVNGDTALLKRLLVAGVPVLIETWYEPKPNDGMGHYRLLVGYDDNRRVWLAYDSYESGGVPRDQPYTGITLPYLTLDDLWAVFNRAYVVLYDEARRPAVEAILGEDLDDAFMARRSLADARAAVEAKPADPFAWFNLGSSYIAVGDYAQAATAYDKARRLRLPWRMMWYQFGPFRAYYEVGRYAEVVSLADATLRTAKNVEELHFWRGLALYALGDTAAARAAWERALAVNNTHADSKAALAATAAP